MILTGKALTDFGLWHFENGSSFEYINFHNLSDNLRNALIIEWFDSVEIHVYIYPIGGYIGYHIEHKNDWYKSKETTRQEATEKAIEKANKLYNEHKTV